jgi:hypothetical protein
MGEHAHGPSPAASVILDLTEHTGALILDTGPHLVGAEIEISPADGGARTHSMVRERLTEPRQYSAVYPSLASGDYVLWHDESTPGATVTITGGQVTRHRLAPSNTGS